MWLCVALHQGKRCVSSCTPFRDVPMKGCLPAYANPSAARARSSSHAPYCAFIPGGSVHQIHWVSHDTSGQARIGRINTPQATGPSAAAAAAFFASSAFAPFSAFSASSTSCPS